MKVGQEPFRTNEVNPALFRVLQGILPYHDSGEDNQADKSILFRRERGTTRLFLADIV